jgi:thymidylate synthase
MIHTLSATTCTDAWLQAVNLLQDRNEQLAYNLILDIEQATTMAPHDRAVIAAVDNFLQGHDAQPIMTVAATIFPASYYRHRGRLGVFEDFPKVYPKIKEANSWGTYAGRMLIRVDKNGKTFNPLERIIDKLRQQTRRRNALRAVYDIGLLDIFADIPLYDPATDTRLTRNQPCLSHLSFKLRHDHSLMLTALYRSHHYIERALGNFIGLSQLLLFVATEAKLTPANLIIHSSYAKIDYDGGWNRRAVRNLLGECNAVADQQLTTPDEPARIRCS